MDDIKHNIEPLTLPTTIVESVPKLARTKLIIRDCELEHATKPEPRKINVRISFYTNQDNALEGGQYDKQGGLLLDYDYPIVAMPADVPYGSKLVIKGIIFTVVDTGSAMKWTGENECNVDVFIPNKTTEWLNEHTGVFYSEAELYIEGGNN